MVVPVDARIRRRALDPRSSFIVQAPAGSGKTELLTRRVLTLLCTVDEPEEILAITFTRKAASEMRQRVIDMLELADSGVEPDDAYAQEGLALARAVLQRDRQMNWRIIQNPQRLNLRTIDSLATQLAYRLPVTSALGAPVGVVENAGELYSEVASQFIESNLPALSRVLLQVGNKLDRAQTLLANLLANRDQWKRHVYGMGDDHDSLRQVLEAMLAELVQSRMAYLCSLFPIELKESLLTRLRMASAFLLEDHEGDIARLTPEQQYWVDIEQLPGSHFNDVEGWRSVADALLTANSEPRKRLTIREGFPSPGTAKKRGCEKSLLELHKQNMLQLIEVAAQSPAFIAALKEVRKLPNPQYQDEQWELLCELLTVLPDLLVELQWVFSQRKQVDFAEVAERAQRALGTSDEPTDLALAMDLSLKHVLVDEFQDTSQTQFSLFARLVHDWSADDGRTFFAVGDPMQSIYRFRDGDVTLFAQAQQQGIGSVALEPLTLSVNFRAAPQIIEWVNETFSVIFPDKADPDTGAVPYSPSDAFLDTQGRIDIHPLIDADAKQEARLVAHLCQQAIAVDAQHQAAILVRSRSQAVHILAALRDLGLAYQSIDMDLIGKREVVQDIVALTLALRYPHDRLHWLAVLRSPFVGLTLHDLHALMLNSGKAASVIELLQDSERRSGITEDGQLRIERLLRVIEPAVVRTPRMRIMPWVESVWLQLGGPAVCHDDVDLDAAERAMVVLAELDAQGQLWQKSAIEAAMQKLFAAPSMDQNCQIQIMTLHKSKGLEFDTVIVPALGRKSGSDTTQLLNWFEHTLDGKPQLLLAPFEQPGLPEHQRDRINRLVKTARERCDEQEQMRLLYVACTRAKYQLHLIGNADLDKNGNLKAPVRASLLAALWPSLESVFASSQAGDSDQTRKQAGVLNMTETHPEACAQLDLGIDQEQPTAPVLKRLSLSAQFPDMDVFSLKRGKTLDTPAQTAIEYQWAGRDARDIGTVIHHQLQQLAQSTDTRVGSLRADTEKRIALQLRNLGFRQEKIKAAGAIVIQALKNTLADKRGKWILANHSEARSEWAISVPQTDGSGPSGVVSESFQHQRSIPVKQVVIDRTFVDETGIRWIIDYKTGDHTGGQVAEFLDREQKRYSDQLNGYAEIIGRLDNRPIRVGLYFPMLKGWREWVPVNKNSLSQ